MPLKNEDWKSTVVTFGKKHLGKTFFQVYVNDYSYITWMLSECSNLPEDMRTAAESARAHKDAVDPFSAGDLK